MQFRSLMFAAIALLVSNAVATCIHDPVGSACTWGPDDVSRVFVSSSRRRKKSLKHTSITVPASFVGSLADLANSRTGSTFLATASATETATKTTKHSTLYYTGTIGQPRERLERWGIDTMSCGIEPERYWNVGMDQIIYIK
ncbi:hypothetical protein Tdes44962_MAKER01435 [Teratosphaeria destructans]|uniref:Uncharacterized protein n=1 Tax=Teratosphaeria destructans TaxID=418781 RepID=A0A9W7SZ94_9PEZI|nr:hypothetical protein Tdes44962_MAKER01435 [Teratosphaeria destructans]